MARIRNTNTKPELLLRRALWAAGLRYRLRARVPIGRPDIVFASKKVVVFVDGCFWHGCPEHYVPPRSRVQYWTAKLASNVSRDAMQTRELSRLGWRVLRPLACNVTNNVTAVVGTVENALAGVSWDPDQMLRVTRVDWLDADGEREKRHVISLLDPAYGEEIVRPRSFLAS